MNSTLAICILNKWNTLPFIKYSLSLLCCYRERQKPPGTCELNAHIQLETLSLPAMPPMGLKGKYMELAECV